MPRQNYPPFSAKSRFFMSAINGECEQRLFFAVVGPRHELGDAVAEQRFMKW
jgi:hypothetical protein